MRRFTGFIMVLAMLLTAVGASATGILPVLQTPVPKMEPALSYHELTSSSAPKATTKTVGGFTAYTYSYTSVTIDDYEMFGRALGQEGYSLTSGGISEAVVTAEVSQGVGAISISYQIKDQKLSVTYAPGMELREYNKEDPYQLRRDAVSILPVIPQAISLQSVTAKSSSSIETTEDGGRQYNYTGVSYACYEAFSSALGAEGYSLVSSEVLEDGYVRAVVSNGEVSLTVDYHLDDQKARVIYPVGIYARPARKYQDYQTVRDGEAFSQMEGITVTPLGWQKVDSYVDYYYSNRWIPSKYFDTEHVSENGVQQILVTFEVAHDRPDSRSCTGLLNKLYVRLGNTVLTTEVGRLTSANKIYADSDDKISGTKTFTYAIGFELTEAQLARLDEVTISFSALDDSAWRVYYLQAPAEE